MSIKRLNNKSGMIMLIAITFILMMSIILAGLFSRHISTSLSIIDKSKRIKADLLARGSFWKAYNQLCATNALPANTSETIDGILYTITFARNTATDPDTITVTVSYPD